MNSHEVEFCWRIRQLAVTEASVEPLVAPMIDGLEGSVLEPSLVRAVVRISPYANMSSGDQLVLYWEGLDIEGFAYQYESVRFISQAQVGKDVIFVIKGMHIAALEGGSLEVYCTLQTALAPKAVESARLQLSVGDVRTQLLAPLIENSVNGALDPPRVVEGTLVTLQPYARMSAGDRVMLSWHGDTSPEIFTDSLNVEATPSRKACHSGCRAVTSKRIVVARWLSPTVSNHALERFEFRNLRRFTSGRPCVGNWLRRMSLRRLKTCCQ
ncbi:hypothetical protein [Pseudomonas sp. TSRC2-2]|uniref:hypothetical protein n=1 Tax=unclassified Pseudomonas TaxID=196821 RepID=UPI003CF226D7